MYKTEFFLLLIWLVLLPIFCGLVLLRIWHTHSSELRKRRYLGFAVVFIFITAVIAFAFIAAGPAWLGRYIGVRDVVIFGFSTMWAPFAYIAAAIALLVTYSLNRTSIFRH
jgi:Zn-dependent protease